MSLSSNNSFSIQHPHVTAFFDLVRDFVYVLFNGIQLEFQLCLPLLLLDTLLIDGDRHLLVLLLQLKYHKSVKLNDTYALLLNVKVLKGMLLVAIGRKLGVKTRH
jgi:hypothetical protein